MDKITLPREFPERVLSWYDRGHRQLPWREDKDPYHIWLSEIMLQQTRVEAVKAYYSRFLQVLPTIGDLANADDELLHKLWEGLGYYSRVRNLKKAAIAICRDHGGKFPEQYRDVRALPGIGPYTAGAICSIAFDQPVAAVDGNVLRVVSRLTADNTPIDSPAYKKTVEESLNAIYPKRAGDFTQALMELGATVCGPNKAPECAACPCSGFCKAKLQGNPEEYPAKTAKKQRRQEDMTVLILSCQGRFALEKRGDRGLLADLWQFPNIPGHLELSEVIRYLEERQILVKDILRQTEKKHIFTHVQWNMRGFYLEVREETERFSWMDPQRIYTFAALPTAFRQFWEEVEHF